MKKFIIAFLLLCSFACITHAKETNTVDSIIVNIGKKKKIILWGETREDLKALEKFDLNRILLQMNRDLEEMPTNVRRSFRQDYEGNSYTKETSEQLYLQQLTPWQRLTRNTYLNFSVGLNSSTYLVTYNPTYNPFKLTDAIFRQRLLTSPHLGIALMRQESFTRTNHKEIVLRYGFDISWYHLSNVSTHNTAYLLRINSLDNTKYDTLALYRPAKTGNYYNVENLTTNTVYPKEYAPNTPNQSLLYADFKIVPTINFYGRNNQKTFNFGLGAYIGMLLRGSRNYAEIRALNQLETRVSIKNKENPYRYGLIINVGYGIVNVFLEADIKNVFVHQIDRTLATQNLTTFGLRFGR